MKFVKISLYIFGMLFVLGISSQAYTQIDPGVSDAIAQVQERKTIAENKAKEIKNRQNSPSEAILEAKDIYTLAQAAVNAWLKGLRVDLATGKLNDSIQHRERLKHAIEKANDFEIYANKILQRGAGGFKKMIIAAIFGDFADKMFDAKSKADQEERERIRQELDELSWKDFDSL